MKNAPTFLIALLSGCVSGAVTTFFLMGSSQREPEAPRLARSDADVTTAVDVEAVTARLDVLAERIEALELRPREERREPVSGFVTPEELEERLAALTKSASPRKKEAPELTPENEDFRKSVEGALADIRRTERIEQVRGYQEKRSERLETDIAYLSEKLELNGYQAEELRTVLSDQYEREAELTAMWVDGVDDEVLGQRKQEDGERFTEDLGEVLTPDQVSRFWEVVGEGRGK